MNGSQTARILVADDHEANKQIVARMLEHWGYEVLTASSGRNVLRILEHTSVDLIMMDCLMPDIDGFEATRAIRDADGSKFNTETPIIAITALSAPEDLERCLECGMDDFITKPIIASELRRRVVRVLDESRAMGRLDSQVLGGVDERPPSDTDDGTLSAIVRSMSSLVTRDVEEWQVRLADHCRLQEWDQIRMIAHRARGSADLLGNSRLSSLSAQIEQSAMAADGIGVNQFMDAFRRELRRVVRDLKAGL